jgi:hypothetical protein
VLVRRAPLLAVLVLVGFVTPARGAADRPEQLAKAFTDAVRRVNEEHARKPAKTQEADLGRRLPKAAREALEQLLKLERTPGLDDALLACGEAALDLDLQGEFQRLRARLEGSSPEHASRLGTALSRPRFVLRGLGGLDEAYLRGFAEVLDAVLDAYDELFGFQEWSKVPGKKLRVRVHLEAKITRPPHFAPELPFHSEVDFPVADGTGFRSPTPDGKFLFYGLCHELGHVIAMWGDRSSEEDRHTWAHYTGVLLVEHLSAEAGSKPWLKDLRDAGWRSLAKERERLAKTRPGTGSADEVMALWIALHDAVGPKAIGDAINLLDREDRRLRIRHVRYYKLRELRDGLLRAIKDPQKLKAIEGLLPANVETQRPKR